MVEFGNKAQGVDTSMIGENEMEAAMSMAWDMINSNGNDYIEFGEFMAAYHQSQEGGDDKPFEYYWNQVEDKA